MRIALKEFANKIQIGQRPRERERERERERRDNKNFIWLSTGLRVFVHPSNERVK